MSAANSPERHTRELEQIDPLTGLNTRAWLQNDLPDLIRGHNSEIGIVLLDLDGLKKVNDTFGHDAGDMLIKGAATVLDSIPESKAIRLGGDEFVLCKMGVSNVDELEKVKLSLRQELDIGGFQASMGTALYTGQTIGKLLGEADRQMYRDKDKRRIERYTPQQLEVITRLGAVSTTNGIDPRDITPILFHLANQARRRETK